MENDSKTEAIRRAFVNFKTKMSDIQRRQLLLLGKIDGIISREKADKIREKISHNKNI